MSPVLQLKYTSSAVASRIMTHILIVPILIFSISHLSTGQNLDELEQLHSFKVVAALKGITHSLECFGETFKETLHASKQKDDALTALGNLPQMMMALKTDVEILKKRSVGGELKEETHVQENKYLKTQLKDKDNKLKQLEQDLKTVRKENENIVLKVAQLEQDLKAKDTEVEQQIKKVEDADKELHTLKEDSKQEVLQLENDIKKLKNELENKNKQISMLNRKTDAAYMFTEQLKLKKQLEQFNSAKDWPSLRNYLETLLDLDSPAYIQLMNITIREGSPIWKIGFKGYTELAMVTVSLGLAANVADRDGDTLLHGAAQGAHVRLAEMLLDHGVGVVARGWKNSTVITRLTGNDQLEMLKLFDEHGADVNSMRSDGTSSLHWAAFYGDLEAVKYLVDSGAYTAMKDNGGMTPLDKAQRRSHEAVVEYLSQLPH